MNYHYLKFSQKYIFLFLFLVSFSAFAQSQYQCSSLFLLNEQEINRLRTIRDKKTPELDDLLSYLKKDGQLVYQGDHKYQPGSEYLASNEFDWLGTPFDHKKADTLIAFGTNSAWEIAVDKDVETLYIADWSPYPLLASAYIIKPLIKIANNPKEFIILLSGRIPNEELIKESLDEVFRLSARYASITNPEKLYETRLFLEFLSRHSEISDFELKFMVSYFYGLAENSNSNSIGPFHNLRYASYAKLLNFFDQRYSPTIARAMNENVIKTTTLDSASVFSSLANFQKLKKLFDGKNVLYGLTSITDIHFYMKVLAAGKKWNQKYALSFTNIFDCGYYNGLTLKQMKSLLRKIVTIFKSDITNPLVVFRTAGVAPPHKFHRYDLTTTKQVDDIPEN